MSLNTPVSNFGTYFDNSIDFSISIRLKRITNVDLALQNSYFPFQSVIHVNFISILAYKSSVNIPGMIGLIRWVNLIEYARL